MMRGKQGFNWVQFAFGAIIGVPIGFYLWMSLGIELVYSAIAGAICVIGMALLVGWYVTSRPG
jgi:hypothetical protein